MKDQRLHITVLDGNTLNPGDLSWEYLEEFGTYEVFDATPNHLIIHRSKDADILITNKVPIFRKEIDSLPKLKMIAISATGTNNVDVEYARKKGIVVKNVAGYSTKAVAQHVFALLLELIHQCSNHHKAVDDLTWHHSGAFSFFLSPWIELEHKTLGIFGLGTIGCLVAEIGQAFGMNVIATNRTNQSYGLDIQMVSPDDLLSRSDILSLHAPLTPATKYFINTDSLSKMKANAILINTARGQLVQEHDLASALKQGVIRAAGLDVLQSEPPPADHPLYRLPNCLITPHMAWTSTEARMKLMEGLKHNIKSL